MARKPPPRPLSQAAIAHLHNQIAQARRDHLRACRSLRRLRIGVLCAILSAGTFAGAVLHYMPWSILHLHTVQGSDFHNAASLSAITFDRWEFIAWDGAITYAPDLDTCARLLFASDSGGRECTLAKH